MAYQRPRQVGTENQLYEQVARYLNTHYPGTPYHFDLSGVWTPSHAARNLYGRLNNRAWPDLFIAAPRRGSHGLFLELKRDGTRLFKKNGHGATPHISEQALVLKYLCESGYNAKFACGLDEARQMINDYMEAGL